MAAITYNVAASVVERGNDQLRHELDLLQKLQLFQQRRT